MVIKWTKEAESRVDDICRFYEEKSLKVAREIFADIRLAVEQLSEHPKMAAIEPILEYRPEGFRSLLVRDIFKVVYFINEAKQEIVIATVFDCRQNPAKLKKVKSQSK